MTGDERVIGSAIALVRERAGLAYGADRADHVRSAIARAAAAAGETDPAVWIARLVAGTADLQPLLEELTVGETYFFRDPAQWAFLERELVPAAVARGARERVAFRAWSAGCASGEEPYTLAIVLVEAGLSGRFRIAATDVSQLALARARRAEYSLWSLRGEPGDRARRHLSQSHGRFQLDRDIAAQVDFFRLNLADGDWPSPARGLAGLDLVLCRNVLIYFDAAHVADVAARLFEALAPGGWLLAGAADPPLARHAPFEVVAGEHGVAYRRPAVGRRSSVPSAGRRVAPAPPARVAGTPGRAPTPRPDLLARRPVGRPVDRPHPGAPPEEEDLDCARCRALLDAGKLPEALVHIDEALERTPLRRALHLQRALVMAELGRMDEAEASARRALYLDRGAPFLHHFLALLRLQRGDLAAAARGFRTVQALCAHLPPDAPVPLSEGMTVEGLDAAARYQLERLGAGPTGGDGA